MPELKIKVMADVSQDSSVIIITGMHRSGTSLTASLLQNAGVEIGDRLMAFEPLDLSDIDYQSLILQDWQELELMKQQLKIIQEQRTKIGKLLMALDSNLLNKTQHKLSGWMQRLTPQQPTVPATETQLERDRWRSVRHTMAFKYAKKLKQFLAKTWLKKAAIKTRSLLTYYAAVISKEPYKSRDFQYQTWLKQNHPRLQNLADMRMQVSTLTYQPLISIIMPVYNPQQEFLRQAIESAIAQIYPNWELCLVDDCSSQPEIRPLLEKYSQKDPRIKVVYHQENQHICRASNSALAIATGEYIALLDHDDLLAPHALSEVVKLLNQHPEADFIYSDEDKVDVHNVHQDPFFKPDWCPDSFLSRMYTCHLAVFRRSLVEEVGRFRVGFEGSQDYDLVLRVSEKTDRIFHIPQMLYHWRINPQSTGGEPDAKPYAADAAQRAIAEAISRRGEPGTVTARPNYVGVYTVRYDLAESKLVSIIVPTKDLADTLDVCLKSIFTKTTYPNYEVIAIDNGSTEAETFRCFDYWQEQQPERFRRYAYNVPFNYSEINNYAVKQAQGDYLLFLNNDTEVVSPDWIEAMVEQAQRESIGAVGSLLLYPNDTVQHAGIVLGIGGVGEHSHRAFAASDPGYFSRLASTNNYSAVTAACLMCRREVFEQVGGFETELAVDFNDVDLCLKILSRGYRNIYLPHVVLYHYESKSRGCKDSPEKLARFARESRYMRQKWHQICDRDPCYSPNLTLKCGDYSLNI